MQDQGSWEKNRGLSVLLTELPHPWQQVTPDAQLVLDYGKPSQLQYEAMYPEKGRVS